MHAKLVSISDASVRDLLSNGKDLAADKYY